MLLAVDIGSTNVKLGVYAGATLTQRWRAPTQREALADEWWVTLAELAETARFDLVQLTAACVSSTAPAVTGPFTRMLRERLGLHALVVQAGLDLGLTLAVDFPEQLGPDRLLDAAAGYARVGGPLVVVDCGTATTFNVVTAAGVFRGGAIAPGAQPAYDALLAATALLPRVPLASPPRALGRDTRSALQSGVILGHAELINGLLARITAELGARPHVLATGGAGAAFVPLCPAIEEYVPHLTLDGLRLAWARNGAA